VRPSASRSSNVIVAGFAARLAVEESIAAQPHALKAIAQATVFVASALLFRAVALLASEARVRGGHV